MGLTPGIIDPTGTMLKWDTSMSSSGVSGMYECCCFVLFSLSRSLSRSCFL